MSRKQLLIFVSCILLISLSGCMYPQSEKSENRVPLDSQIQTVQSAVNQFRKDQNGLLPIKNQDTTVDIYQKYPIDFKRLEKYLPDPPGNAFESGGVFQYVLIDVETNPTVKIYDLRIAETIQDYNLRLSMFRDEHTYPPFKEQLHTDVYTLDYKKIGYKEQPVVDSPYSESQLSIVIDTKGKLFVDYTPDLVKAVEGKDKLTEGEDIRKKLTDDSPFVPAFSLPYTVDENNRPVFMTK
ncbi:MULTISPECIES: hypothetical protein [Bacillus]|uniref:hypothetical protein n=1 Tax=Bacillus TaxID=1386 RepID=UPI0002DA9912|nr:MULTISPECIES: hypothetical protein [Bacillus]